MNVIEATKEAGWPQTAIDMASKQEIERLERFAQVIRNQALEDALAEVEQGIWFDKTTDQILESIADAIRAMKKEQPNG